MFIRKKNKGYYLVKSERIRGRVRQKVLAYLGNQPTVAEAIRHKEKRAAELRKQLAENYDARMCRNYRFTGRTVPMVYSELASYSIAYSRKQGRFWNGTPYELIEDAIAAIQGEKIVYVKYANRYRDVYFPADHPRIRYMVERHQQAKEKHFAALRRELEAVEKAIVALKQRRVDGGLEARRSKSGAATI
jgi:hypothetical protein